MFNIQKFNIQGAYGFYKILYKQHIEKKPFYIDRKIDHEGIISPKDWECFGAILTDDSGKKGHGADLNFYEIKSAKNGNSFEYQYHRNSGLSKLDEDKNVDHIFISYGEDYRFVEVRIMLKKYASDIINRWTHKVKANYDLSNPKQRCRNNMSYLDVKKKSYIIMEIQESNLVPHSENDMFSYES